MLGKWALAKNFTSVVVLVALLLLGNLWLFVWQHVDYEKNRVVQEASREAMNLANAFEAQVRNLIARADDDMQLLKLAYEAEGPSSKIVRQLLTQTVKDPTRFQLGVINEQGVFVVSADTRTRNMNYADRQYFSSQRAATQDQLFIGKTIVSRASGKPVIPLSRRITKPDGSFGEWSIPVWTQIILPVFSPSWKCLQAD